MAETLPSLPPELFKEAQISPEEARMALARALFHDGKLGREEAKAFSGDPAGFEAALFRESGQMDLNDFLDWGSHDLKSPLNSIIGFSRVVLKGIDGPINETQQADISTVYSNGQHLFSLLSMLVYIARLNKGSLHLSLKQVDMAKLLDETVLYWRAHNTTRELSSVIRLEKPLLQVDPTVMKQLIAGALSYAGLQVGQSGKIEMKTSEEDGGVKIRISSHGERDPAMPELERIMLPYINRSLARLHGGELKEHNNSEGGVSLELWLPGWEKSAGTSV